MLERLEDILEKSKICYRESVLLENRILEDGLLSIMSDAKYLLSIATSDLSRKEKNSVNKIVTDVDEIKKVHRKIPQWLDRQHQINHKILVTFMQLSNNNQYPIPVSTLEKNCNIDSKQFNSNYDQMKIISYRNHGKVFEEENGNVRLWEPISKFVIETYSKRFSNSVDLETNDEFFNEDEKIGKFVQNTFKELLENKKINDEEIRNLLNKDYSKEVFDMNFPILKEIDSNRELRKQRQDDNGYDRYYADKFTEKYILCNDWYPRNKPYFEKWLLSISTQKMPTNGEFHG